jgi:hypothetical protein
MVCERCSVLKVTVVRAKQIRVLVLIRPPHCGADGSMHRT